MLQGLYKDKFHESIAQLSAINFAVKERPPEVVVV